MLLKGGPIPLTFTWNCNADRSPIFLGYRPEDSLELHDVFSENTYPFEVKPFLRQAYNLYKKSQPKKNKRAYEGMKKGLSSDELCFNSKFEGGNLDKVVKSALNEYDLYIRTDSNTCGHNQWYYFEVSNITYTREVKFNIVNFSKRDSLYTQGLKPCGYSKLKENKGWQRVGTDIKYGYSKVNKFQSNTRRIYYSLSFNIILMKADVLYLAYSIPYNYSDLIRYANSISGNPHVQYETLCKSIGGVELPLLTITDFESGEDKEHVVVSGRVHPGETNGSWVLEGFINYIIGSTSTAQKLRSQLVFKIVPMLNPDGVVIGNTRCSLVGDDLNRQYLSPNEKLHPTVWHMKNLIKETKKTQKILAYFDFHAHSRKKNVFIYGPHYPLHSKHYYTMRTIPKLLSERTEIFRYYSSKFRNEPCKRNTARLVIWKDIKLPFSFTLETSCHGYLNSERNTIVLEEKLLKSMGQSLAETIQEYLELREEDQKRKEKRKQRRLKKRTGKNSEPETEQPPFDDSDSDSETSSPTRQTRKPTMNDLFRRIKEDIPNENNSDSGGSEEEDEEDEEGPERYHIKQKIISILDQFNSFVEYDSKPSLKPPKIVKKKSEVGPVEARSTLAKYFSRASQSQKRKRKQRSDTASKNLEPIFKNNRARPRPQSKGPDGKFSFSRGLAALRPHFMNGSESKQSAIWGHRKEEERIKTPVLSRRDYANMSITGKRHKPTQFSRQISGPLDPVQ